MPSFFSSRTGYTLLEVLVVITIIAFLAVLTVQFAPRYIKTARDAERATTVKQVRDMVKSARNAGFIEDYALDENMLSRLLRENGLTLKVRKPGFYYVYLYPLPAPQAFGEVSSVDTFAVFTCGEEQEGMVIASGMEEVKKALSSKQDTLCDSMQGFLWEKVPERIFIKGKAYRLIKLPEYE